jgi:hypothetical protein
MKNISFSAFDFKNGELFDYSKNRFPSKLHAWTPEGLSLSTKESTYYGFVYEGSAMLKRTSDPLTAYPICKGMFFCSPEPISIYGGKGIIIERIGYEGMFYIGGPTEDEGRLKYIDGCFDTMILGPLKWGDPCLNALYFPPKINQTMHTHPSMRVGLVLSGRGMCITPQEEVPLFPGQIFIIHEGNENNNPEAGLHCFRTFEDEGMIVIAYHPETEFGPSDESHPMLDRTIVDGVSAKNIDSIRTK